VFVVTFVTFGFWMQHFQTGGLGETVRHPGHHDHRISPPPLTSFCHVFVVTFVTSGFWMQHFQTGRLGETVRHPGHHDHRISPPPLTSFYGGMLSTKCFRHQFQILQILKARIKDGFATISEDMLENTWRETDCRLDVLRATQGAHVEVY